MHASVYDSIRLMVLLADFPFAGHLVRRGGEPTSSTIRLPFGSDGSSVSLTGTGPVVSSGAVVLSTRRSSGELLATAETLHAIVDSTTRRPTRVPAWFEEAIAAAERGS